jgi:hypothetical protein
VSLFPIISEFVVFATTISQSSSTFPVVVFFFFRLCVGMEKLWKVFVEKDATFSFFLAKFGELAF